MKKFESMQEVLDHLKSLDDFEVIECLKVCEDCVYAEDDYQRSIIHLFDRRLINRFEVTGHVEQIFKEQCATQYISDLLKDYLDISKILEFSTYERKIHIKFKDDHVLLVEVFNLNDRLELEVASKYRLENAQICEQISLSTRDRIEIKDLFEKIETFDQKAKKLIEASRN